MGQLGSVTRLFPVGTVVVLVGLLIPIAANAQNDYEGDEAGECTDGADNDRDGKFDCEDDGCSGSPDCRNTETRGGAPAPPQRAVSNEGYVFPADHQLSEFNRRRLGFSTTDDRKTVAWGVGGFTALGIVAGTSVSTTSTRSRILMIDGLGAEFTSTVLFLDRMGETEWLEAYEAAIDREVDAMTERSRRDLRKAALTSSLVGLGLGLAGSVVAREARIAADLSSWHSGCVGSYYGPGNYRACVEPPTRHEASLRVDSDPWAQSTAIAIGAGFGGGFAIAFGGAAEAADDRVRRSIDFDIPIDVVATLVDRHNRGLALQLGAEPASVGTVPDRPDPGAVVRRVIARSQLPDTLRLGR